MWSPAADRGYDAKAFRNELRDNGIRPLIKHRIMNPLNHADNARMDRDRYNRCSMNETVFSSIKRTLGVDVRARSWWWSSVKCSLKPLSTTSAGAFDIREIKLRVHKLQSQLILPDVSHSRILPPEVTNICTKLRPTV